MQLTGWQIVAVLFIAAAIAVAGALLERGSPLIGLAGTIVGGVFGYLQPWRSPQSRTRSGDRTGSFPAPAPDTTPAPVPVPPKR